MSHTMTSLQAMHNDMPVLLVYACPPACVLACGHKHPRAQRVSAADLLRLHSVRARALQACHTCLDAFHPLLH